MSFGSKEGPTTTQTAVNQLSPAAMQMQTNLMDNAAKILGPFLQSPNYAVAGLSPDQTLASDLANQLAMYSSDRINNPTDVLSQMKQAQAQQASAASASAAQLNPGEISPFMNPYISNVLDPTLARLRQQEGEVQSGIGANAAASHMFGGSREAVMRMLADRNYRDTVGQTTGNLLHQGWNLASGLASGNTDRQQQTNMTNAQLANAVAIANAQMGSQASLANANNSLSGLNLQNNINTGNVNNQLAISQMLAGLGGQQQNTMQNAINVPFDNLNRLLQITNAISGGGTTTTTGSSQKPIDLASILLGVGGLFL